MNSELWIFLMLNIIIFHFQHVNHVLNGPTHITQYSWHVANDLKCRHSENVFPNTWRQYELNPG